MDGGKYQAAASDTEILLTMGKYQLMSDDVDELTQWHNQIQQIVTNMSTYNNTHDSVVKHTPIGEFHSPVLGRRRSVKT